MHFWACIRAIHYRDTGQKRADWDIVMPRCVFGPNVTEQFLRDWNRLCSLLMSIGLNENPRPTRQCFNMALFCYKENMPIFHSFYEWFPVYACEVSKRPDKNVRLANGA